MKPIVVLITQLVKAGLASISCIMNTTIGYAGGQSIGLLLLNALRQQIMVNIFVATFQPITETGFDNQPSCITGCSDRSTTLGCRLAQYAASIQYCMNGPCNFSVVCLDHHKKTLD